MFSTGDSVMGMSLPDRPSACVGAAVDGLRATVADLAAVDTADLVDNELEGVLLAVVAEQQRLAAIAGRLAHTWQQRGMWAIDGSLSAAARLTTATNSARSSCQQLLRDGAALAAMPHVAAAINDGALSADLLPLFARARSCGRDQLFERDQTLLIDTCSGLRHGDANKALRYWTVRADTELASGSETNVASADPTVGNVHASTTVDGALIIDGILEAIAGEIVTNELDRLITQLRQSSPNQQLSRSQWRALALVEMATRSASTPARTRRPRPLFTVVIGDHTLTQLCETATGTVLANHQLHPYLGDALIESIIFDGPTQLIASTRQRSFTGALRRGIQARDRRCQHPSGCDTPARNCDIDHITPYTNGGHTNQHNGRLECIPHNRHHQHHDHHTKPPAERPPPTVLDNIRARLKWHALHEHTMQQTQQPHETHQPPRT
jgi:hypothetical protein